MANDGKATRPEDIVRETINKDYIDNAVAERNIGKLASMIKVAHLISDEARHHLADTVYGVMNGSITFAKGRPHKHDEEQRERIVFSIWARKKQNPREKIDSICADLAKGLGVSKSTVEKYEAQRALKEAKLVHSYADRRYA
jgi:DNA-binding XRE family transcriptional regulator